MARKHVNDEGQKLDCSTTPENCNFNDNAGHIDENSTPEEVSEFNRKAEEISQTAAKRQDGNVSTFGTNKKTKIPQGFEDLEDESIEVEEMLTDDGIADEESLEVAWDEREPHNLDVTFTVDNSYVGVNVDTENGVDQTRVKEDLISTLESRDADNESRAYDNLTGQGMRELLDREESFQNRANILRSSLGKAEQEYTPVDDRIESDFKSKYEPLSSTVSNDNEANVDNAEYLIRDYNLDHNNSEVYQDDDGEINMTIEAPNHATHSIYHNPSTDGNTVADMRRSMLNQMEDFDGDEKFGDYWSPGFGEHNGTTASRFYVSLKSDERYFKTRKNDIQKDLE